MRSGEEIQAALRAFVTRWNDYTGTERGGAQTYLAELITCYGSDWRDDLGGKFEDAHTSSSAGIMDLHLPGVAIVEMKAPREAPYLNIHRDQALRYWRHSADAATDRPAPPYVVLCAFQRFEVWEPGRFPTEPRAEFILEGLPQEYEKLVFLAGRGHEPLFGPSYQALTTEAARLMAELYHGLRDRTAAAPEDCQALRAADGLVLVRRRPRHAERAPGAENPQSAGRGSVPVVLRRARRAVRRAERPE